MTGRTHDLAAFTALNIIVATQSIPEVSFSTGVFSIGACFLGGLTPDIDKPTSKFWQEFPAGTLVGKIVHPFIGGHRLISHSIFGFILFGLLSLYLLGLFSGTVIVDMQIVWTAFLIGYVSHLVMDMLTTEGIPLFLPIPIHIGFPPFKALRIKTGGIFERGIVFPVLVLVNLYLFYNYRQIYIHLFKMFIK